MGLEFLQSAMLWGMLAASVPVAIHMLVRRPPIKVLFPAVRFLQGKAVRHATGMKIKRLLLLLLRAAIPALMALIAARGLLASGGQASNLPPAVAIIIDNSPSMLLTDSDGTLLTRALDYSTRIVRNSPSGSLFLVASLNGCRDFVRDPNSALSLLDNAAASLATNSLSVPWEQVRERLATLPDEHPRRIFLLSDFTLRSLDNFQPILEFEGSNVVLVNLGKEITEDRAVLSVEPLTPIVMPGLPSMLRVELSSTADLVSQVIELTVNGRKLLNRSIDLKSGVPIVLDLEFVLDSVPEGVVTGSLGFVKEDAHPINDRAWFTLETQPQVNIAVIYDDASGEQTGFAEIVANAIAPSAQGNAVPYAVVRLALSTLKPEDLVPYRVAYYLSAAKPDDTQGAAINAWIRRGGTFFLFTCRGIDTDAIAQCAGLSSEYAGYSFLDDPVAISSVSPKNFLVEFFRTGINGRLGGVFAMGRDRVSRVLAPARVLLEYEDGLPAVISYPHGSGMSVYINIPLDQSDSNFVRRAVFVPLLHELLKFSSPVASLRRNFMLGRDQVEVAGPVGAQLAMLIEPSGGKKPLTLDSELGIAIVSENLAAGNYVVEFSGDTITTTRGFSMNYSREEGDLTRADEKTILSYFTGSKIVKGLENLWRQAGGALDLNSLLFPLLLILFLIELWLANTFYRAAAKKAELSGAQEQP